MKSADNSDLATMYEEENLRIALLNAKNTRPNALKPIGECYWCGEETENDKQLFCDSDCTKDFEKYNTHK